MRSHRLHCSVLVMMVSLAVPLAHARMPEGSAGRSVSSPSVRPLPSLTGKRARKPSWRHSGQQAMRPARVREIQAALIRENYLHGRATGIWDERSKTAMKHYQHDNHWQSKVVPDSRALIQLGLGPDHAGLINPETADLGFIPGGGTRARVLRTATASR